MIVVEGRWWVRIGWVRESVGGGLAVIACEEWCWWCRAWALRVIEFSCCGVWIGHFVVVSEVKEAESCFEGAPWYRYRLVLFEGKS